MNRLRNPKWRFAAVLATAAALAAILVGASQVSADDATADAPSADAASKEPADTLEPSLFAGIEQQGVALGSSDAPVTLVEYADLQCPYCAQWARETLPTLVEDYVKTGKLRIVFHGLAFIGADSDKALRTAIAARPWTTSQRWLSRPPTARHWPTCCSRLARLGEDIPPLPSST